MAKQTVDEKRRLRTWVAAQIASALVRTYGEPQPAMRKLAWDAVAITDTLLARLDETDPYGDA